eukprot:COSAG05_NODE_1774_length_4111_cov_5.453444_2_plen_345_part_00
MLSAARSLGVVLLRLLLLLQLNKLPPAFAATTAAGITLSNVLGDGMVLQRAPHRAVVWGFGEPGVSVTTTLAGRTLSAAKVNADGVWRVKLPVTLASKTPTTIRFEGSDGSTAKLSKVLFGEVFLCSGQSNMQYTPRSTWLGTGMNNATVEIAAADGYATTIRLFTVGQQTDCTGSFDCSKPFLQLNANINASGPCTPRQSCRHEWSKASSRLVGGAAWDTFSSLCWLTGRDIHDSLGGKVPVGLISSNWGGTPVQTWQPLSSLADCPAKPAGFGPPSAALFNSMIAPFTQMALRGVLFYQGESTDCLRDLLRINLTYIHTCMHTYMCATAAAGYQIEFNVEHD